MWQTRTTLCVSGDIVQVRVVEVDSARRRISLSLLVEDES